MRWKPWPIKQSQLISETGAAGFYTVNSSLKQGLQAFTLSTLLWNRGCRLLHSQLFSETGAAGFYTLNSSLKQGLQAFTLSTLLWNRGCRLYPLRIIIEEASWTLSQKLSYNDKQRMNTVNAARVELGVGDDTNHMTLKEPPANTEWHIFLFLPYLNRMLNRNSG